MWGRQRRKTVNWRSGSMQGDRNKINPVVEVNQLQEIRKIKQRLYILFPP
jgi:hypothetical protein